MNRKDFFAKVGFGAAAALLPACIAGIASSCSSDSSSTSTPVPAPASVDFILDVSTGSLNANGGFLVTNGIVVARTNLGTFIAVSASCTHEGTNVNYNVSNNNFVCPNHNAKFSSTGVVTQGPASTNLKQYNTSLTGNTLRVYS
ncbi:cytochrome b6-f complex iron-sulfur subunit [Flavobacterium sp. CG_9.10]|uniref:QcrA and Rieske domain-containing protein n=1 Tax=Flavobacterium sp. CG_9.10 TaxID=2787729 RepID=UPI0018C95CDC|nr:Rieske (2Fe-2S) protein [Flavobacterium sp. CG_9.10]MBG6111396.1 cytochrome b6-f complex iron-sulfur subunit [Flavobacterium sp. CG_9.10]